MDIFTILFTILYYILYCEYKSIIERKQRFSVVVAQQAHDLLDQSSNPGIRSVYIMFQI